jgi:hypothetical protein
VSRALGRVARVISPLAAAASLAGPLPAARADFPILRLWPDINFPCDTTLQACVSGANPSDGILIATDGPIDESITIDKSLTLSAESGFRPLFSASHTVEAVLTGADGHSIDIEGLWFDAGAILVNQAASGPLTARVAGNRLLSSFSNGTPAIELRTGGADPVGSITFELSDNTMSVPAGDHQTGINVESANGSDCTGRIAGNVIEMEGSSDGAAIQVSNPAGASLSADVIGNEILGAAFDLGIAIRQGSATGSSEVRILGNLVIGQGGEIGGPGAVAFSGSASTLTATVVNNTVVNGEDGIQGTASGSGTVEGLVANNLVSGNSHSGIQIDSALTDTLLNRNNLVFANGINSFTPGPGTITDDPLFVDPHDDYHLKFGSPAIDAGDDSVVPATDIDGKAITDLDGNARIQGSHVDIGAYETAPEPAATLGTAASLSVLAALALRRRRLP